ncbi:ATP phosphoribosyltransferase regulatory subunit [Rhizobium sp. KVB221]|uniref:ATP phosphoribosyltransferase regulatory subunit n=1 Tax=Rhizobium setariae TaxID=2801340 RepID=A0A936YKU8_9HYPH|nr:ATP phosphoribosyltransferase regulatory subunit [Rhizobium setariae]MBL0370577.1 ATP phosphoribosyltransferase regulatory subunit [Rhizobium setariae]
MPLINLPDFSNELLSLFETLKTDRVDTPVIQPAEPFLNMAGEDLRRRIFMTESETGESLCLRPEFTIPVCLQHIETATGTPKRYSYLGEVFRQRREGGKEFYQAGIEDLGTKDVAGADARAVADAIATLKALLPGQPLAVTMGDQSVFEAVVEALGLPSGWQRRLVHAFGEASKLDAMIARLARPESVTDLGAEVEAMLAAGDEATLIGHIDAIMQATGYSSNASRSPASIARRLREKRALASTALDPAKLEVLKEFLSLSVSLKYAPDVFATFARSAGLKLDGAVDRFDARVAALTGIGVDLSTVTWRAAFGRPLDYYTGLVFEITVREDHRVLAGGGRFDRMMTLLGAAEEIPAVGFALWLDRIEAVRGEIV